MTKDVKHPSAADFIRWGIEQGAFSPTPNPLDRQVAEQVFQLIEAEFARVVSESGQAPADRHQDLGDPSVDNGATEDPDRWPRVFEETLRRRAQQIDATEYLLRRAVDETCRIHAPAISASQGIDQERIRDIFFSIGSTLEQFDLLGLRVDLGLSAPIPPINDYRYLATEVGTDGIQVPQWVRAQFEY